MVVVPTTYGTAHEDNLYDAGANIFIYANQLMRAKIHAVDEYLVSSGADIRKVIPASLLATAEARNHGYLLQALQMLKAQNGGRGGLKLSPATEGFLAGAEVAAYYAMQDTAQRLLDNKQAGAADDYIIPVKDLLAINGVHLSDLGRMPQEGEDGQSQESTDVYMRLMSRLRIRATSGLRNGTRWFA